jgi:protein ImuB
MYAAVWIRFFALQAVLRSESFAPASCVAILRETAQRSIIFQANSFARQQGVQEGQTISHAIAKCRDLCVRPRKPLAEKSARHSLFHCLYAITPQIEATEEETYTLDLGGIAAGARRERMQHLLEQLQQQGFFPQIGVAATPDWACYASRCAAPLLWVDEVQQVFPQIPIHTAIHHERLLGTLQTWGIRSLADYARLSRQAVADRLGKPGLDAWDSIHNPTPRLLRIETPPPVFKASMELEFEIQTLEPLRFLFRRLTDQLLIALKAHFRHAQVLILQLDLDGIAPYRRVFKLPEPTTDPHRLLQILHTHLEQLQTTAPIIAVALELIPTEAPASQHQLFQQQVRDPWQFGSTLHQLIGLLGSENVGSPLCQNTHEPDAFQMVPLSTTLDALPDHGQAPDALRDTSLKLQRFRPPLAARVQLSQGRPIHLESSCPNPSLTGPIRSCNGPWQLSGTWWDARQWQRQEWDIQLASGPLLRLLFTGARWYVEGAYG